MYGAAHAGCRPREPLVERIQLDIHFVSGKSGLGADMAKIDAFFKLMHEQGASDLHLVAGQSPALRVRGDIERIKYKELTNDDLRAMLYEVTPE